MVLKESPLLPEMTQRVMSLCRPQRHVEGWDWQTGCEDPILEAAAPGRPRTRQPLVLTPEWRISLAGRDS